MYLVEIGVPLPEWPHPGNPHASDNQRKYPWKAMLIGNSFFVPNGNRHNLYATARMATQRFYPKRFRAKQQDGGIRIWRVE